MLLLLPADAATSPPEGAVLQALALVRASIDALDDAAPALLALRHDTDWRSDGIEALQTVLGEMLARTRSTRGELASHERALERIGS